VDDLVGRPIFLALYPYFLKYGGVFKLAFGPKVFMVLSDPVIVREVLKEKPFSFSKGVLAEILEPIMGQGLIPAPYAIWKNRRRQLVPGFHKAWLDHMVGLFGDCSLELTRNMDKAIEDAAAGSSRGVATIDMEERFCSVSLDIIGLAVFNYDFGSTTRESPIIKAVYTCLQEAAHRSTFYFPYWNIPFMTSVVPRQREFKKNMELINETLNGLIAKAQKFEGTEDLEELQNRDYSKVRDPSLLRFLVDIRGADVTDVQLRDDLMTMLIAGHETTAAVLTWCLFCLAQDPALMEETRAEIDRVLGPAREHARAPTYDEITRLQLTRLCLAEALRLYPEPPILIRRCLEDVPLPKGAGQSEVTLLKGMDVFISVWNLHRHPECWEDPLTFNPKRFLKPYSNPGVEGWNGYDPELFDNKKSLYPNEVASDFAFVPFGAGARKCIGDQFAMLEATSCLSMVLQRYEFELDKDASDVGMEMGATIHTAGGLPMRVARRPAVP
jgi:cytochrome P450